MYSGLAVNRNIVTIAQYGVAFSGVTKNDDTWVPKGTEVIKGIMFPRLHSLEGLRCKHLMLKNSSAIGEKVNDILVSYRQKYNGMSWFKKGSLALTALTAVKRNKENQSWLEKRKL